MHVLVCHCTAAGTTIPKQGVMQVSYPCLWPVLSFIIQGVDHPHLGSHHPPHHHHLITSCCCLLNLPGGIQHYLEAFPDGGYFKGKNFVYDDRGAVGPEQGPGEVVGTCIGCSTQYDDYGPRCRCR